MATEFDYSNLPVETKTSTEKCPNCGANLIYDPKRGVLYCEHCDTVIEFKEANSSEQSFDNLFKATGWAEEARVFSCPNCGSKEVISKSEIAKTCSFCGTAVVVDNSAIPGLRPNAVVPFKIVLQDAVDRVIAWAKKRLFAPSAFKKSVTPENTHGVYNPVFTFDSQTFTQYNGVLERTEFYTVKVGGKPVTKTRTVRFGINGTFSHFFDDVLIQASSAVAEATIAHLQPFDTNASKTYTPEYLMGFTAAQYTKDGKRCWDECRAKMDTFIKKSVLSRYQYTRIVSFNANTIHSKTTYKYLLLPLWIGHTTFKQKLYNFFVNGHNGKVAGKTPISPLRVTIAGLLGAGILVGAYFLLKLAGVI